MSAIDQEIAKLHEIKRLLGSAHEVIPKLVKRGRPKGSRNSAKTLASATPKRVLSTEGRAKIAAAQKARWAAKKTPVKASKAAKGAGTKTSKE